MLWSPLFPTPSSPLSFPVSVRQGEALNHKATSSKPPGGRQPSPSPSDPSPAGTWLNKASAPLTHWGERSNGASQGRDEICHLPHPGSGQQWHGATRAGRGDGTPVTGSAGASWRCGTRLQLGPRPDGTAVRGHWDTTATSSHAPLPAGMVAQTHGCLEGSEGKSSS